jgi:GTP-binding protein EngB required for normal cell division
MVGLSQNHKRRLIATFQQADELLTQSLNIIAPARSGLCSRYVGDISPSELHWIESYAERIREQIGSLLERFEISLPAPSTASSWILKTNLISLDIMLEDLYPERMRGYGEIDKKTASDLTWTLQEVRRLLSQLFAFLKEEIGSQEKQLARIQAEPAFVAVLQQMSQIISRHGLVEFLPELNSITRKLESHRYEIAVFGRVGAGKSSLINRLLEIRLLPVGATPITAVPIHIIGGQDSRLRVTFVDRMLELGIESLPDFGTEQGNPANSKRVMGLEVVVPSKRLQEGIAFVDTPGIASLATTGTKLAYAYLPDSDFGIVLVDSQSALGRDDLDILRALHMAGIPCVVMISKCDLLCQADVGKVLSYTRSEIQAHLAVSLEVIPISSVDSWLPEINRWFETAISPLLQRARESLVDSMNRKMHSLRRSLLATLELRAPRFTDDGRQLQQAEQLLRPLDESLGEFSQRWSKKFESIKDCAEEVLEDAAMQMAQESDNGRKMERNHAGIIADTLIRVVMSRCNPFLSEYQALSEKISSQLNSMKENDSESPAQYYEAPKASGLPAPVLSLLDGIKLSGPGVLMGINQAARERHFRKELRDKAREPIDKVLEEFSPRLRHWFQSTVSDLKNSYLIQTDPMRYRHQGSGFEIPEEVLRSDMELLKAQFLETANAPNP